MRYAEHTSVSVARSKAEIEETVTRYGARSFATVIQDEKAGILFEIGGRRIRFTLPLPPRADFKTVKKWGKPRAVPEEQQAIFWEQACRQRWRSLALAVKAKLEAVESGIATVEDEFHAYIVLPDGRTIGEVMRPQIAAAYETGKMPPLLALGDGRRK